MRPTDTWRLGVNALKGTHRAGWAGRVAFAAALLAGLIDTNGAAADTWGLPAVVNQDYSHERAPRGRTRGGGMAAPPVRPDEGGRVTFAAALDAWLCGGRSTQAGATIRLG